MGTYEGLLGTQATEQPRPLATGRCVEWWSVSRPRQGDIKAGPRI